MDAEQDDLAMEDPRADSKLKDAALYTNLKQLFRLDDAHSQEWRKQAKEDFDFIAGDQWDKPVAKMLEDQGRAPLTFNLASPYIRAVCGLEIATRHETSYIPRVVEEGDIVANEVVGSTAKWMGDNCDAEDEQSAVFQNSITCGMGWSESRFDYEVEKDGQYVEESLDPIEMRWDYAAKKRNLQDSRRMWRVRSFTLQEAQERFPGVLDSDLNCSWALGLDSETEAKSIEERRLKLENSLPADPKNIVHIVQVQWYEREKYYRVAGDQGEVEVSEKDWKALKRQLKAASKASGAPYQLPMAVEAYRRVYKQAFIGGKILELTPCPDPYGFTLQCITGLHHKTKNTWYGLVRLMRDPQMNANKWISQALHILNSTAKGGILAERGAFHDLSEAQRTYANPQAITFTEEGAIKDGRIMQKPGAGLAGPYVQLLQFAVDCIPKAVGVPIEILGLREVNQPGVLEAQRKQAGMTILGTLFDSLRQYRKTNGRIRLCFMQKYIPDGRLIRINGPDGMKAARFLRDKHLGEYDVIVSDAPTSPNQKEATWTMIMQLMQLPQFAAMVERDPKVGVELLQYCPLPSRLVALLRQSIAEPKPEQEAQQQIAMANAKAELEGKAATTEKDKTASQLNSAKSILTMADAAVKAAQAQEANALRIAAERAAMLPSGIGSLFPSIQPVTDGEAVFPTQSVRQLPMPIEAPIEPAPQTIVPRIPQ